MSDALVRYVEAERMLSEIQTMDDADAVMRLAEAARVFAERGRLGTEMMNHATAIKLKAGLRLVTLYDAQNPGAGRPPSNSGEHPELPIKPRQATDLRRLAAALPTDDAVDAAAAAASKADKQLTLGTLLRQARDAEAAAAREDAAEAARDLPRLPTSELRVGDFREALAGLDGVDAIITDPPYPAEFLPLLSDLASFADTALTDDGVLAVLFGQTHLPEVYERLSGGRPYRWTLAYLTPGAGYVSHARKVQSNWKPVLVYGGGPRFGDVLQSSGDDKRFHSWGQDVSAFADLVERLTPAGALVCDPFLGGGATAIAAHLTGRRFIGCDIDETAVLTARGRLAA